MGGWSVSLDFHCSLGPPRGVGACNLVPRALFPGFGGGAAREKRPGDAVEERGLISRTAAGNRAHNI